ncbi:MAG: peptidylprolyl isomerase [Bacteroidales bacterium]|nr:peptidylprolyl isomerase [Candidatus Physcousia equi]
MKKLFLYSFFSLISLFASAQQTNVVDEVIWVVGDEAILKSDVESMRRDPDWNKIQGNPYCVIPERIAIQKLFIHQAAIDSIEVTDVEVNRAVEAQLNEWVMRAGSREKLEEYMNMPFSQIREEMFEQMKNQSLTERMQEKLTKNVKVNPADVRRYFKDMPEDSLPYIQTQVEVEVIMKQPEVPREEIERVKSRLRELADRVNKGESFAMLAKLYCQDDSRRQGGELGYLGKAQLDASFANVAFSLTDPKKVSKVVESEFGYHIIQLIDKRGDKVNCRHIIMRPELDQANIDTCMSKLDSLTQDVRMNKYTFEEAAFHVSDDKDTRNNHGLMSRMIATSEGAERTSRFTMSDLAQLSPEIARAVEALEIGEISKPFQMVNQKGQQVCAVVKLKSRIKAHHATMQEDFQVLKDVVLSKKKQDVILAWIKDKQKSTYVRINEEYHNCEFQYPGWVK